jgi:hypothetical protein
MIHEFTEETQKFLSTTEKRRLRQIDRKLYGLLSSVKYARDNIELYEKDMERLDYEKNTLYYKARAKLELACPHDSVNGPYTCARDDCSGGHIHCNKCHAMLHTNPKNKGKRYMTWDELYPDKKRK